MSALQVIDEELGELTPNGIPVSLRLFFQEYTLENLAPQTDSFTIIERTLSRGNRRELRWLFRLYPREQIAEMVSYSGWWLIPRHRFDYWRNILNIVEYRKSDYQRIWPH